MKTQFKTLKLTVSCLAATLLALVSSQASSRSLIPSLCVLQVSGGNLEANRIFVDQFVNLLRTVEDVDPRIVDLLLRGHLASDDTLVGVIFGVKDGVQAEQLLAYSEGFASRPESSGIHYGAIGVDLEGKPSFSVFGTWSTIKTMIMDATLGGFYAYRSVSLNDLRVRMSNGLLAHGIISGGAEFMLSFSNPVNRELMESLAVVGPSAGNSLKRRLMFPKVSDGKLLEIFDYFKSLYIESSNTPVLSLMVSSEKMEIYKFEGSFEQLAWLLQNLPVLAVWDVSN